MSLLIIILNYRTPKLTVDCLASLAPCVEEVPETRVLVVDNASGDGSAAQIREAIDAGGWRWCRLMENATNDGFAGGNNRGVEQIRRHYPQTKYVLFLNSDTIVNARVLRHCIDVMNLDPSIGALSCMLKNADGSVQNTARKFPSPLRQTAATLGLPWHFPKAFGWADIEDPAWDRSAGPRDVEWLGGAFLLTRRELIDRIGPMDESFFFYGEDIEFCHRVKKAGYRRVYDPSVWITHFGGSSSDPTRVSTKKKNVFAWQARYRIQRRCYGWWAAAWLRMVDVLAYSMRCAKLKLTGRAAQPESRSQFDILALLTRPLRSHSAGGN